MAVVLRNGIRNCLEAAGVVAQGDGFAGRCLLIVLIFLVSRQHEIFVAIVVQIGESETTRPPVGLREDGIWGYGEPVSATYRELVWLKRTTRVPLLNKGMVVGERTEEEIEILIVLTSPQATPCPHLSLVTSSVMPSWSVTSEKVMFVVPGDGGATEQAACATQINASTTPTAILPPSCAPNCGAT